MDHFEWEKPIAASLLSQNYVNYVNIFPKRYCESLLVKGLQNYDSSNFEDDPMVQDSNLGRIQVVWIWQGGKFFSNLQLWQLVTMKPFDLQRPTVPLWKDLYPFVNIVSAQETCSIVKMGFVIDAISEERKWKLLQSCTQSINGWVVSLYECTMFQPLQYWNILSKLNMIFCNISLNKASLPRLKIICIPTYWFSHNLKNNEIWYSLIHLSISSYFIFWGG